jgi:hypothetical protein
MWFALGDSAEVTLKSYVRDYLGVFGDAAATMTADACRGFDAGAIRDAVAAADEAGCDEFFLVPASTDVTLVERILAALDH